MKRKLGDVDWTSKEAPASPPPKPAAATPSTFTSLALDPRLMQAVGQLNYVKPTPVQAHTIPPALEGKDILARAKTGSGKTAAYLLPILQRILEAKDAADAGADNLTAGLILVPTRELADQVHKMIEGFTTFCGKQIRAANIARNISDSIQQSLLLDRPDIVVSTPSRAAIHFNTETLDLTLLRYLVVDEADLILSYGHENDMQVLAGALPKGVQTFLMSATLTDDVQQLTELFCRHPFTYRPDQKAEDGESGGAVSQFYISTGEDTKFLLLYVIFKLKLIKGKSIIFVADVDRCYRLRLFLEQFGIRACVLNSELPVNSRLHIVEEFNKNVYEIIIATDENEIMGEEEDDEGDDEDDTATTTADNNEEGPAKPKKQKKKQKKKKQRKRDSEYGVSRGVDFQNVACVLNFDLPLTAKSYTHRIGRTARAGNAGMALSFIVPRDLHGKHRATSVESTAHDDKVLDKIKRQQAKLGRELAPYKFDMKQVDAFRYRMDDALRAVTKVAVQNARMKELRQELLASEKLKRHFEENPEDLRHLRHDREIKVVRVQSHLKRVPEYLLAKGQAASMVQQGGAAGGGNVPFKVGGGRRRVIHGKGKAKGRSSKPGRKDPLKSFGKSKK
ncbi:ATP-dependent RNA helicase dbp9 [Drechslerella stenobrocha 248]|uniref:RNA helicase n=1 Tax=Drechslerella stenobrocha 248 TaxID=1043628 RepID=W7HU71_9PEZI|nr:ATP-dependent RNA helicase dbp9 [Drechslerella stenobrocha 248]